MAAISRALVRRPSSRLAEGITTHVDRAGIDVDLAMEQWNGYVTTLADAGWDIVEVSSADGPDSVYVEDTVVMYGSLAVLTNPGAPTRTDEVPGVAHTLQELGYDTETVIAPGTLDGGDVLKIGSTVYVGRGDRTNAAGVRQLRAALAPRGARVVVVRMTRALHLKSAATALPDGTVIGWSPVVDDPSFFPHYLAMPEEPGAHVVDLGAGRLLISSAAPRSAALLADLGYDMVPVDISEFEKREACVTCLSVRLRTAP